MRNYRNFLKIFFGIVIIALLIYLLRKIDLYEIYLVFRQTNPLFFIPAFFAYSLSFLVFSLRTMYFLKWVVKPDWWFFLKVTFAGSFINTITPGAQIGGEPVKAYYLGKKHNKPVSKVFGAVSADRFFHGFISFLFIVFSMIYLLAFISLPSGLRLFFQIFVLLTFMGFTVIFLYLLVKTRFDFKNLFKKFKWLSWANPINLGKKWKKFTGKNVSNFTSSFKKTLTNRRAIVFGTLFSLIYWGLNYLSFYFLFLSFGTKVNFFLIIVVVSLANLMGDFSPTPGGVGLTEGVTVFLYSILGVNFSLALLVAIVSRAIFYFHSLLMGGISLAYLESIFGKE